MRKRTQRERKRRGMIEGEGGRGWGEREAGMEGREERENTDMSIYFKKSECLVAL